MGGGVLVGYIWTIFPVPITEASVLRRDLGGSLWLLGKLQYPKSLLSRRKKHANSTITVAKYLSCVTATVDQKLIDADSGSSSDHGKHLEKARNKLLAHQITMINGMKANLSFLPYEPRFGGSFPRKVYEELVDEVQRYVLAHSQARVK